MGGKWQTINGLAAREIGKQREKGYVVYRPPRGSVGVEAGKRRKKDWIEYLGKWILGGGGMGMAPHRRWRTKTHSDLTFPLSSLGNRFVCFALLGCTNY